MKSSDSFIPLSMTDSWTKRGVVSREASLENVSLQRGFEKRMMEMYMLVALKLLSADL